MGWVSAIGREIARVADAPPVAAIKPDVEIAAAGAAVGAALPAETAEERARNVLALGGGMAAARRLAPGRADATQPGGFAGTSARTADLRKLERAQAMEGAGIEPRQIWQETGWLKGDEGAWKFEINDQAAQLRLSETPKVAWEFDLEEVFDHPELFAAYPELRSTQVVFKDLGPLARDSEGNIVQGSQGAYDNFFRTILINNRLTREEAREAILHEGQHGIQDIEGFAKGGMPEPGREVYAGEEIEAAFVRLGDLKLRHDAAPDDASRAQIAREMETLKGQIREQSQIEAYLRLPGEVEARLVERRKDMTPEQRRAAFPNDMRDMEPVAQAEPMGMAASSFPRPVAIVREAQQIAVKEFEQRTDKIFEKFGLEADAERASMREQLQTEAYDVIETRSAEIRTAEQVKADEALAKVPEQIAAYRQKNADRFDEDTLDERASEYERTLQDRINERMERSIERQVDKLESEVDDHMISTMWEKYEEEIGVEKTREMISELRSVTEEYRAQYGDDFIKSLSEEEGNNRIWWDDWTEGESALAMRGGPLTRTERAEWQQAEAKGLDMSEPARAQRAEAQGYTIEAFRGIRVAPGAGELTDKQILGGAWFAETPETANSYAADVLMSRNKGFVMKARLRMENPLVIDAGGAMFDRIAAGKLKGIFPDGLLEGKKHLTTQEVASLARAMGHDGVEFQNIRADRDSTALTTKPSRIWVSFKPENVRSANAAFDPMSEGQAGLMLSQKGGPLVDQAKQQGYQGADTGESAEWLSAVQKGLPMETEARMARAKEMGFDTGKVFYHGTDADIRRFNASGRGTFGEGVYLTGNPKLASDYATQEGGNVLPVYVKGKIATEADIDPDIPAYGGGSDKAYDAYSKGFSGYLHKYSDGTEELIVFDPANIRSVHAAFDPDKAASSTLLAGFGDDVVTAALAGGAIASGFIARDQMLSEQREGGDQQEDQPAAPQIPADAPENAVRRLMRDPDEGEMLDMSRVNDPAYFGVEDFDDLPADDPLREEWFRRAMIERGMRERAARAYYEDNPDG